MENFDIANEAQNQAANVQAAITGKTTIITKTIQEPGINHADIIARAKADLKERMKHTANPFPVDVFPMPVQEFIAEAVRANSLPVGYYASSIMSVAGAMLGNKYHLRYKTTRKYSSIIWTCLVGTSGMGKSPTIKLCLEPLKEVERELKEEWRSRKVVYDRENALFKMKMGGEEEPIEPIRREMLVQDSTLEAIIGCLEANQVGILSFHDELLSWFNSMNQYRRGSDGEFWLSAWDNVGHKVKRKDYNIDLDSTFICVIGGIQPARLKEIAKGGRDGNGHLPRMLFEYPDIMEIPAVTDEVFHEEVMHGYNAIMRYLYDGLPSRMQAPDGEHPYWHFDSIAMSMKDDARKRYNAWSNEGRKKANATDNESIKSLYMKMENYCLRFALILELMDKEFIGTYSDLFPDAKAFTALPEECTISKHSIEAGIRLCAYYHHNALKVLEELDSPIDVLKPRQKALYAVLPDSFTAKDAITVGEGVEVSKSTVKRFLNQGLDAGIFRKKGTSYLKRYEM